VRVIAQCCDGARGPLTNEAPRRQRVQVTRGGAAQPLFDPDTLGGWREPRRFIDGHAVAGNKQDRYVVVRRDERIERRLAGDMPVDTDRVDGVGAVGVREDGRRGADRAVIADEENAVERAIEPLHHVEWFVTPTDEGRFSGQLVGA